jgi:glycosyltransferase involved in cell wall biosynthesis
MRRLKIVYVLDSAGAARAGGLVSGDRVISRLREHHEITSVGVGGDVPLPVLTLPLVNDLVKGNSFAFARPDAGELDRAMEGADVVHVQLPFFLGFRALRLARERGIPVVGAHHVQPENILFSLGTRMPHLAGWLNHRGVVRSLNWMLVKSFYDRTDVIICPSELARNELLDAKLTVPTVIISNGAPERFAPLPVRPKGRFTVLSVGRLVPEKRHDVILEAAKRSKHSSELSVVIAGKGALLDSRLHAQAYGHPSQVELGFVSDDRLLELYQTADMYVHASEVELEGMAALEAMRCGCPSVLCDSPASATKQFALGPEHLFPPGDASALARRIDDWFEHPAKLEALRAQTLESVRGLGLDATLLAYERLYLSLAEHRPPSTSEAPLAAA